MSVREEAHRLLDEVPEDRLTDAIDMLRRWAGPEPGNVPRRQFRTTAIFDGEHDLGTRAKQIVRDVWSGGETTTTYSLSTPARWSPPPTGKTTTRFTAVPGS